MSAHPPTVGPYTVESELGRGGMGVVLAAHDERLGRRVALKSITPELADNPERLARFEREVRLLAAVSHPSIATVYGLEEQDGSRYMVMELVEGQTLAQIIDERRLAVDEAISICAQIAGAIEAAHNAGIVHRDLKPANVIVKDDGTAKVLDFGLARADDLTSVSSDAIPTASMPIGPVTREGIAIGTPSYMSPEQARGRSVSKTSDVFSFGCVLFECLTGRLAFDGDTPTDAIAALIEREPDYSLLPPSTPHRVRLILERCLRKDARERLRDMGDARLELETALRNREWTTTQLDLAATSAAPRQRTGALGWLVAAALALGLAAMTWWMFGRSSPSTMPEPIRFSIDLPAEGTLGLGRAMNAFDISPDGRTITYIYEPPDADPQLHICSLDSFEHRVVEEVKQPRGPAFSPDGKWIAYLDNFEHIKRVPVAGGPAQLIGTPQMSGAAHGPLVWLDNANIAFSDGADKIQRINVTTGAFSTITEPHDQLLGFTEPIITPNHEALLASSWTGFKRSTNCVAWIDLQSGAGRPVLHRATNPQVVDDRFLIFNRDGALWAVEFDFKAIMPIGEPRLMLPGVAASKWDNSAAYRISESGHLIFTPGTREGVGRRLVYADRTGTLTRAIDFDGPLMNNCAITHDGTQLAWTSLDDQVALWVADLTTGTRQRFQTDGEIYGPLFSSDATSIYLLLMQDGVPYAEELDLATGRFARIPNSERVSVNTIAPDGSLLGTRGDEGQTNFDIIRIFPDDNWRTVPFIATANMEWAFPGSISPDGKWLLYGSTKSGRGELYVRQYPEGDRDWRLPIATADEAAWSSNGSSIFLSAGDAVPGYHEMTFTVDPDTGAPVMGEPKLLFTSRTPVETSTFCVTPDDRLLFVDLAEWEKQPARINVILNWSTELKNLFDGPQ